MERKHTTQPINLDPSISEYLEHNGHIENGSSNDSPLVSVIIPLYNEEKSIKNVIEKIPNSFNHEILIVDDGSTDNSIEEVKKISHKFIKIIRHRKNRGYGSALLTGFKYTTGDIIITLDSDGQHDPRDIPKLLEPILRKEADLAIGSRYLGKTYYPVPLHVRFGEFFIRKFLRVFYHKEIANNQSGFRAFHRSLLTHLNGFYDCGMAFSTELLLKTLEVNKKILEVPISLKPRKYGQSYVKLTKILIKIILCLFVYGFRKFRITRKLSNKYLSYLFIKFN